MIAGECDSCTYGIVKWSSYTVPMCYKGPAFSTSLAIRPADKSYCDWRLGGACYYTSKE